MRGFDDPRWPRGRVLNALLLAGSLVPVLFVGRTLGMLLWLGALGALWTARGSRARVLVPLWGAVVLSAFLPFDLSLIERPGPPHFARLVMGLALHREMEAKYQCDVVMGGCATTGFEPRWVWVW